MSAEPEKRDIVITRIFDAPVEQVWKAWSDGEHVMRWWGPTGFTSPRAAMDFREGGTSLVCMRAPKEFGGQDMYNTWTYRNIVPMQVIDFIQSFADENGQKIDPATLGLPPEMPQDVRTVVTFKSQGDNKTEIIVTEYDWPVGQMMEMSKMGMEQCLDKMAEGLK
ncbi:MAG: SRPBCC domain-containing protein [Blastochloris sp.]|nr:SRPBCC domain-containing protein [Blastochloris sp.]